MYYTGTSTIIVLLRFCSLGGAGIPPGAFVIFNFSLSHRSKFISRTCKSFQLIKQLRFNFSGEQMWLQFNFREIEYLYRQLSLCFRKALLVLKEKRSFIFMKKLWVGISFCALWMKGMTSILCCTEYKDTPGLQYVSQRVLSYGSYDLKYTHNFCSISRQSAFQSLIQFLPS